MHRHDIATWLLFLTTSLKKNVNKKIIDASVNEFDLIFWNFRRHINRVVYIILMINEPLWSWPIRCLIFVMCYLSTFEAKYNVTWNIWGILLNQNCFFCPSNKVFNCGDFTYFRLCFDIRFAYDTLIASTI